MVRFAAAAFGEATAVVAFGDSRPRRWLRGTWPWQRAQPRSPTFSASSPFSGRLVRFYATLAPLSVIIEVTTHERFPDHSLSEQRGAAPAARFCSAPWDTRGRVTCSRSLCESSRSATASF